MINRKRKYWDEDLRWYFETYSKMSDMEDLTGTSVRVVWQDGLPLDEQEIVENVVRQVNAGLMSKLTAVKTINETDDMEAGKELEQINSEKQTQADIDSTRFKVQLPE